MSIKKVGSIFAFVMMVGFLLTSCGGGGQQTQTTQDTADQVAQTSATGSLAATVNFEGEQPDLETFDASGNPECGVDSIKSKKVVVNDNGTLKNVVIAVKKGPSGLEKSNPESVTIDQQNCQYKPHVAAVKAGQTFTITDSDEGLHNVRATQDGRQLFNKSTFKGAKKEASFSEPGVYSLECNVHPWMQGWVYVTEHGRAAVTGDGGEASLSDLPTGEYTIVAWHEKYGTKTKKVRVEKDKSASISFTFSS